MVLGGVDLTVCPGQVHALLGANGAGKSTLIKCLAGVVPFDGGTIELVGTPLEGLTPSKAFAQGIAVIHQHLSLIDVLTVVDNLFLGQEKTTGGLINRRVQRREARELLDRFQINVDLDARVGSLPMGTKQLIEIAKVWHHTDVRVLVLDEPTAPLSRSETRRLFAEVDRMRKFGARIIYTTHRLAEVFGLADEVTVLRDGQVILHDQTSAVTSGDLVASISGGLAAATRRPASRVGAPVLTCSGLQGPRFGPIDLQVRAGEIVGLYGVLGSGRSSFLETLAGHLSADSGRVLVDDTPVPAGPPARKLRAGIALVPADRHRQAMWSTRAASDNILLPSLGRLSKFGLRSFAAERRAFEETATTVDLRPKDPRVRAFELSGGNQQKLVLARWLALADDLRLLLLDEPTQGVDVGARRKIYETCQALADQGLGVLFASTDAEEVSVLADRALVVDDGSVVAEFKGAELTERNLIERAHQFTGSPT